MNIISIIEARMGSKRLPGKVMLKVNKKPMIQHLVERINKVKEIKEVVVATTTNKKDDTLVNFCQKKKISFFRGSEKNVVKRIHEASKKFKADVIISITGDCPVIDYRLIKNALKVFLKKKPNIVSNSHVRSFPDGMDCTITDFKTLKKINSNAKGNIEREHTFMHVERNLKKFNLINIYAQKNLFWPELGLTLDEQKDFIFLKKIMNHFYKRKIEFFSCGQIIKFLKKNPRLLSINNRVIRNKII